jgi:hypothetical protein
MNDSNLTMRRRKFVFFYILTVVLACFIIYTSFEIVLHLLNLSDVSLIPGIDEHFAWTSRTESYFNWEAPIYS